MLFSVRNNPMNYYQGKSFPPKRQSIVNQCEIVCDAFPAQNVYGMGTVIGCVMPTIWV